MAGTRKREVITFKVDDLLWEAMRGIPNRSEFIREAILSALDTACPLCRGVGSLSADQQKHWDTFTESHSLEKCDDCHAVHLVCEATER